MQFFLKELFLEVNDPCRLNSMPRAPATPESFIDERFPALTTSVA
jgi:hypothetical protein